MRRLSSNQRQIIPADFIEEVLPINDEHDSLESYSNSLVQNDDININEFIDSLLGSFPGDLIEKVTSILLGDNVELNDEEKSLLLANENVKAFLFFEV